ncbi:hypothetical protein H2198_005085 [Neophaeococcomyces mojaviensis]|uniref:Uncharacterized protein n=1 Tax=Neophaeococcomyces mojaviensis TaxID=3383035 RepID=A0ACC3A6Z4_9EURO|nr:hypothetical protein H2198_005085 [Knufia sp. JES_112]
MNSNEEHDYLTTETSYDPNYRSASPFLPPTPRRGSNESSTAGSDYGQEVKDLISKTATAKAVDAFHTKSHVNMRIHDSTGRCMYYVDNSAFTIGKPDVTLCAGTEKNGPILGVCRWSNMYSKHYNVGVGNPTTNEKGTIWEEVKVSHHRHPEWQWSMTLPSRARHSFTWHRITGDELKAADEDANKMSRKNVKLVDSETGEVLVVFGSNRFKSWKKFGKFTFNVDGRERGWGDNWEMMVLLTALGLVEMSRRRARQRRSTPGQGGP